VFSSFAYLSQFSYFGFRGPSSNGPESGAKLVDIFLLLASDS